MVVLRTPRSRKDARAAATIRRSISGSRSAPSCVMAPIVGGRSPSGGRPAATDDVVVEVELLHPVPVVEVGPRAADHDPPGLVAVPGGHPAVGPDGSVQRGVQLVVVVPEDVA